MKDKGISALNSQHIPDTEAKPRSPWHVLGDIFFYGVLLLLILAAVFSKSAGSGAPKVIGGYAGMIVLTESMQNEIPKGSLVITKRVDPDTLSIGDDITFMANETTSVTHRIIGILERYEDTGQRAFETKGTMNKNPDERLVLEMNVVGKVVYHSHPLGKAVAFISANWPILLFLFAVGIVLLHVLERILMPDRSEEKDSTAA